MPIDQAVHSPRLDAYVQGAVGGAERAAIERHLAACRECRRTVITQLIVAGVATPYSDS